VEDGSDCREHYVITKQLRGAYGLVGSAASARADKSEHHCPTYQVVFPWIFDVRHR
jgi:hypothetical protein